VRTRDVGRRQTAPVESADCEGRRREGFLLISLAEEGSNVRESNRVESSRVESTLGGCFQCLGARVLARHTPEGT